MDESDHARTHARMQRACVRAIRSQCHARTLDRMLGSSDVIMRGDRCSFSKHEGSGRGYRVG
uniref:Uncharacterized protein n=1 Tax=Oryza glumipatula TaxID=40148 RepID=A0A0D9Z741_9ORYZ